LYQEVKHGFHNRNEILDPISNNFNNINYIYITRNEYRFLNYYYSLFKNVSKLYCKSLYFNDIVKDMNLKFINVAGTLSIHDPINVKFKSFTIDIYIY